MIKKKRAKVKQEEKERIIQISLEPECDIRLLANKYQLSTNTIRRWRVAHKKARETATPAQFVEIAAPMDRQSNSLQKIDVNCN